MNILRVGALCILCCGLVACDPMRTAGMAVAPCWRPIKVLPTPLLLSWLRLLRGTVCGRVPKLRDWAKTAGSVFKIDPCICAGRSLTLRLSFS
jgi:hypothetical protein